MPTPFYDPTNVPNRDSATSIWGGTAGRRPTRPAPRPTPGLRTPQPAPQRPQEAPFAQAPQTGAEQGQQFNPLMFGDKPSNILLDALGGIPAGNVGAGLVGRDSLPASPATPSSPYEAGPSLRAPNTPAYGGNRRGTRFLPPNGVPLPYDGPTTPYHPNDARRSGPEVFPGFVVDLPLQQIPLSPINPIVPTANEKDVAATMTAGRANTARGGPGSVRPDDLIDLRSGQRQRHGMQRLQGIQFHPGIAGGPGLVNGLLAALGGVGGDLGGGGIGSNDLGGVRVS